MMLAVTLVAVLGLMTAGSASAEQVAPDGVEQSPGSHLPVQFIVTQVGNTQFTTITFEGGGFSGTGTHGIAPTAGVTFSANSLLLIDFDAGGSGNIANEPSGDAVAFWLTGTLITLTFSQPTSDVSLFYSSSVPVSLQAFDAGAILLQTVNGPAQHNDSCVGDPNGSFCNYSPLSINTGMNVIASVTFNGVLNQTVIDDFKFSNNLIPDAMDDVADDTVTNQPVAIAVLANDDLGDEPAMVTVTTPPANGMTSQVACDMATEANKGNCLVTHTPNAGFGGDDFFIYTLTDFNGDTDTARVDVFVDGTIAVAEPDGDNNVVVSAGAGDPNNPNIVTMSYTKVDVAGQVDFFVCAAPALRETWGHGYGKFGFFKPKFINVQTILDAAGEECADVRAKVPDPIYFSPTQRVLPNPNLSDADREDLYFGKEPEDFEARANLRWVIGIIDSDVVNTGVALIEANSAQVAAVGYEGQCFDDTVPDRPDVREFRGVMGGASIDPPERIRVFRTTTWECNRSRAGRRSTTHISAFNMRNHHFSKIGFKVETFLSLVQLRSEIKRELKSTSCEFDVTAELNALKAQVKRTKLAFLRARTPEQVLDNALPEFVELTFQTVSFPACLSNIGARLAELAGGATFTACDYSGHPVDRVQADCPIAQDVLDVIISEPPSP